MYINLSCLGDRFGVIDCCNANVQHSECLPVRVPGDTNCQHPLSRYARAGAATNPSCALGPRQQGNSATAYLDASVLYGSTDDQSQLSKRRLFQFGQ